MPPLLSLSGDVEEGRVMYGRGQLMLLEEAGNGGGSLPAGVGWAWNGAWTDGGRLPKAAEPGLLLKASKLAKPP